MASLSKIIQQKSVWLNDEINERKVLIYDHNLPYDSKGRGGQYKIKVYRWSFGLFFRKYFILFPYHCEWSIFPPCINAGLGDVSYFELKKAMMWLVRLWLCASKDVAWILWFDSLSWKEYTPNSLGLRMRHVKQTKTPRAAGSRKRR